MPADIKKKMQALKDNGSYKDNMTDEEISNAFEKMGNMDEAPKAKAVAQNSELLTAINALTAKVLDTGLTENALKTLDVSDLQSLHNKHTGQTFALNGVRKPKAVEDDYSDSFNNVEAK